MGSSFAISTIFNGRDRLSPVFKRMGRSAGVFGSVLKAQLVGDAIKKGFTFLRGQMGSFITEASKIEDATAGFTPLLGGVEKAQQLVEALNQTAATTPFQFDNISSAAKQLLPVMNQDIQRTVDTFRMLGDTAGGNAQKLDSITRGFTKAMLKGKVDMESLNMIAEAGVPIYSELSNSMGVSVAEMMKLSSAGKITSDDLTNAFKAMTSEGGIFFNGMQIASQTLSGKMSTLRDNIALTKAQIGGALLPTLKPLIDRGIEIAGVIRNWVSANNELINDKVNNFFNGVYSTISKLKPMIETAIPVITRLGQSIVNIAKAAAPLVIPALQLIGGVLSFILPIVDRLVFEFAEFMTVLNQTGIMNNFIAAFGRIGDAIQPLKAIVMDIISTFFRFLETSGALKIIVSLLKALGNVLLLVGGAFKLLWSIAKPIIGLLLKIITPVVLAVTKIVEGITFLTGKIGKGLGAVGDFFNPNASDAGLEAPNAREAEARMQTQTSNVNIMLAKELEAIKQESRGQGAPNVNIMQMGFNQ